MQNQKPPLKKRLLALVIAFLNPRFILCFGMGWMITNGWCYLGILLGTLFSWNWLTIISGAYASLLWFPMTPEKLITLWLAILLLKRLFPDDKKTLLTLHNEYVAVKGSVKKQYEKLKRFFRKQ